MTEKKADDGDSTYEAVEAPTRTVVARPRLLVVIAAVPKRPAEVLQWASVIGVARRVIGRVTAQRSYVANAKGGGTLSMPIIPYAWIDAQSMQRTVARFRCPSLFERKSCHRGGERGWVKERLPRRRYGPMPNFQGLRDGQDNRWFEGRGVSLAGRRRGLYMR